MRMRMFVLFGLTIAITFVVAGTTYHLTGGTSWRTDLERAQRFVGHQLARTWEDPARRDELAQSMAEDLEIHITLHSAQGQRLTEYGPSCSGRSWEQSVQKQGRLLGSATLCIPSRKSGWRSAAAVLLVCVVLWGLAGWVTRGLILPVERVAEVARKLGSGQFGARVQLSRPAPPEIRGLAQTINDMADRIEKQMRDQRELLAAVSHEMRTPLTRLRVITELVRDGAADAKVLDDMEAEVRELDALIGQLLASSRLEFGALQKRELRARDVAKEAVERAGECCDAIEDETDNVTFEADPTLVARALANLLGNALKHGKRLSRLRISASETRLTFSVYDEGSGFPAEALERAFEPFYQAKGAGHAPGSIGLGLSLVRRIAEAHGGSAHAENLDGGACVHFSVSR